MGDVNNNEVTLFSSENEVGQNDQDYNVSVGLESPLAKLILEPTTSESDEESAKSEDDPAIGKATEEREAAKFIFHFPDEVWRIILEYVKDGRDLHNCCLAFRYLDNILMENKPAWLSETVLPMVYPYLCKSAILACRGLTNKLCGDVDSRIRSHRFSRVNLHSFRMFTSPEQVDQFLARFEGHPRERSPFIDGTVNIKIEENMGQPQEFLERVLELLEQFGAHVIIFNCMGFFEGLGPFSFYRFLQNALIHSPNLVHLKIFGTALHNGADPTTYGQRMRSFITDNPMPLIPTLKLIWCAASNAPQCITNPLLSPFANQLSQLSIGMDNWNPLFARGFVALTKLQVTNIDSDDRLSELESLTAPLKELALGVNRNSPFRVPVLLQFLANFPLLDHVSLLSGDSNSIILVDGEEPCNVTNSTVKSFRTTHGQAFSHNFLRSFTNLERLVAGLLGPLQLHLEVNEAVDDVQFYRMLKPGEMYNSNIWDIIPSLNYVKIFHQNIDPLAFTLDNQKQYEVVGWRDGFQKYRRSYPTSSGAETA